MQEELAELLVPSADGTAEPSLFYAAGAHRPLLVGLHTWSYDRFNQVDNLLPLAKKNGWNLLLPEFRGPNLPENPRCREACGSRLARQDVLDAVSYVTSHFDIDERNILLFGASGGGHMALLLAAAEPTLWRAVAAVVPIADLSAWRTETPAYAAAVEACCGGDEAEYRDRSPITYLDELAKANVKIFSGKWDTVVPFAEGLTLYEKLVAAHPETHAYFEVFDGRHEMRVADAERFFKDEMTAAADLVSVTG